MKKFFKLSLLVFFLMSNVAMFAQTGPGGDTGGGGLEGGDPPPAPINNQLILLALLGTLVVFYSYKQKNKKA
ncbi:hypothetical protein [Flavobacterium sp. XGLA_31]|uniref:hypothetical protein n=1 Tax=Flavobacterium sp. XGLA_31 TaxID=3447666 RepID=UPI003F3B35BF